MKYSIIMPYHKKRTLQNTLLSYLHFYQGRTDYEVVLMEDHKNVADDDERRALRTILNRFSPQMNIHHVETYFDNCFAPSRMFNAGVMYAQGEYVVLTSPECFHMVDILKGFDKELDKNPDAYIVPACYNTDDTKTVAKFAEFKPLRKIWLQHSKHLNRGLYWCAVLSKAQYSVVGGIDEEYAEGFGREDIDFVRTLKAKSVKIITRDDLLVVHQNHPDCSPQKKELWARNKRYYDKKWEGK